MPKSGTLKPQRGRPTAKQAEAITQAIMDAATTLFQRQGYDAATMQSIAAEAGIPKSTLYKRYADKVSLLEALLEYKVSQWGGRSAVLASNLPNDLEARLKQRLRNIIEWSSNDEIRIFQRLALGIGEGADVIRHFMVDTGYAAVIDSIEADIRQFAAPAGIHPNDPRGVALALLSMLTGWVATQPLENAVPQAEAFAFAERAVELLIAGKSAW